MARKTVEISSLIDEVNRRNKASTCVPGIREGWNSLLETVLMQAEVYHGYGYLKADDVPNGHAPGITVGDDGKNSFPDETRRHYHYHRHLSKKS